MKILNNQIDKQTCNSKGNNRIIRKAILQDIDFLTRSYITAAQHGHFIMQPTIIHVYQMFMSVIEKGGFRIELDNGDIYYVKMDILILTIDNYIAGFQAISPAIEKNSVELYYCFVDPEYRNKGVMQELINYVIDKYPSKTRFTSRCFKVSEIAIKILKKMNFTLYKETLIMEYLQYIK